jgi:hypothetical protein
VHLRPVEVAELIGDRRNGEFFHRIRNNSPNRAARTPSATGPTFLTDAVHERRHHDEQRELNASTPASQPPVEA